ncbi:hypothetical protein U1Q18_021744 [Sarracenia purpurea var. burkii]
MRSLSLTPPWLAATDAALHRRRRLNLTSASTRRPSSVRKEANRERRRDRSSDRGKRGRCRCFGSERDFKKGEDNHGYRSGGSRRSCRLKREEEEEL